MRRPLSMCSCGLPSSDAICTVCSRHSLSASSIQRAPPHLGKMAATAQRRASVSSSGSNIYDDDTIVNPSTTVGRRDQQAIGGNGPATSASPRNQGKSAKAVDTSNNFGNYGTGGQYVHMGSGQMIINAGSNSIFQSMVNGAFVEDDEEHASRLSNAERRAQFVAGRVVSMGSPRLASTD